MEERELRALVGQVKAGTARLPTQAAGAAVRLLRLDATSLG